MAQKLFSCQMLVSRGELDKYLTYDDVELMIDHALGEIDQFVPACMLVNFRDRMGIIQSKGLSCLFPHASVAHPALWDVTVTELIEILAPKPLLELVVAGIAQAKDIFI